MVRGVLREPRKLAMCCWHFAVLRRPRPYAALDFGAHFRLRPGQVVRRLEVEPEFCRRVESAAEAHRRVGGDAARVAEYGADPVCRYVQRRRQSVGAQGPRPRGGIERIAPGGVVIRVARLSPRIREADR